MNLKYPNYNRKLVGELYDFADMTALSIYLEDDDIDLY
jgi:hypothetical protein